VRAIRRHGSEGGAAQTNALSLPYRIGFGALIPLTDALLCDAVLWTGTVPRLWSERATLIILMDASEIWTLYTHNRG